MTFICQSCSSTHLFMFIHPSNYINLSLHWHSSVSPVHPLIYLCSSIHPITSSCPFIDIHLSVLFIHTSIHSSILSIYSCIYPSFHLSICLAIHPFILLFICLSIHPSIHPLFVHRSIHWCSSIRPIHPYILSSRCSSRCPSIRSSIYSSILPSSSVHPCISFILPFVHPFIHPSLYLFTCSSIHPSFIHPSCPSFIFSLTLSDPSIFSIVLCVWLKLIHSHINVQIHI